MATKLISALALAFGVFSLFHSGYSAREHILNAAHESQDVKSSLPLDIVLECLLGMILSIIGSVFIISPFSDIMMETELKKYSMDGIFSTPNFTVLGPKIRV
ncbi:Membrane magnesium transporter 2 [Smittium culicis]|uniref:Membrane magnesium transporter 2 n=2 Tax=Smittium culicis TaxID=133412 RepID=A0A1R1XJS1_9FUNG|nr:Membrane magnesium transporter 2 [Smittium culicis]